MHSNTFTGSALGLAAAAAALQAYQKEKIFHQNNTSYRYLHKAMQQAADDTGLLSNIRSLGWITAADITVNGKKLPAEKRTGFKFFRQAVKNGALLRPLGDTIYFMPPCNVSRKTIAKLAAITARTLKEII